MRARAVVTILGCLALALPPGARAARAADPLAACRDALPIVSCLRGSPLDPPGAIHARPGAASATPSPDCALPGFDDRCEVWTSRIDDPEGYLVGGFQQTTGVAASPDGARVFVIAITAGSATVSLDWQVAALDGATGATLWSARRDGPRHGHDTPWGIAVSPDGARVFVTGTVDATESETADISTVAYDAATGAERWAATYDGPDRLSDGGRIVAATASGVYVAGLSHGAGTDHDAITLAYDPASGEPLWSARHTGPGGEHIEEPFALAVSSGRILVAGASGWGEDFDALALAYDAASGAPLWARTVDAGAHGDDEAAAIAVDPSTGRVVLGGLAQPPASGLEAGTYTFATIALDATSGATAWTDYYRPPALAGPSAGIGLAVALAGGRAYTTGLAGSLFATADYAYATVAHDLATGARAWTAEFRPPGATYNLPTAIVATPDRVVVAGDSFEGFFSYKGAVATVAYDARSGAQEWVARYTRVFDDVADLLPYVVYAAHVPGRVLVAGTYVNYFLDEEGAGANNFSDAWTLSYDV